MDHFPSSRVTTLLRRVPPAVLQEAGDRVLEEGRRRDMYFHFERGVRRYIPMALKPWIVTAEQRRALREVALTVESAALRVHRAWFERPDLQEILPITDGERRWLEEAYRGGRRRPETLMARCDLAVHLGQADWRRRMRVLETNLVGIGAAYYCYCAGRIAAEVLAPLLGLRGLRPEDDLLDMILGQCRAHGRKIGRSDPTVALLEYRRALEGPFEFETMARLYRERGHRVVVADPVELDMHRGEITCRGTRIDILYRDPTLLDLVRMEEDGDDLRAVRHAFRRNQVVSSLGGEVDHKGLLEAFSSPRFERLFAAGERAVLRRHVPWTRVLRDGTDLPEVVRRRRERLVIKPNREYGGKGVQVGAHLTAAAWDRLIDEAVRHPGRYVAQERVPFNREDTLVTEGGRPRWRRRYLVTGVHAAGRGTALLGRVSDEPVVNITRGGAIVGVLRIGGKPLNNRSSKC